MPAAVAVGVEVVFASGVEVVGSGVESEVGVLTVTFCVTEGFGVVLTFSPDFNLLISK